MSGTGVQSAMRRRTRPQEDPRRSNNANMEVNTNTQVNNNLASQVRLSANQIIFSHELKLRDIENRIKTLGGDTITPSIDNEKLESMKKDIEKTLDSKLDIINNNLNFILNAFNQSKEQVKALEGKIAELKLYNNSVAEKINTKLEISEFLEYKENSRLEREINLLNDESDTVGTLETIDIKDTQELEPTESREPSEPGEPVEPVEPVEPGEPVEPVDPVEPREAVEPEENIEGIKMLIENRD